MPRKARRALRVTGLLVVRRGTEQNRGCAARGAVSRARVGSCTERRDFGFTERSLRRRFSEDLERLSGRWRPLAKALVREACRNGRERQLDEERERLNLFIPRAGRVKEVCADCTARQLLS